jgi:hypothetical protein
MDSSAKVVKINGDYIEFDNGMKLSSDHTQDCCETHYLHFSDLSLADFSGYTFNLTSNEFFERVEDYGIRLIPVFGHPVNIPGYGFNNGYYGTNLTLVLSRESEFIKTFDISECQVISG